MFGPEYDEAWSLLAGLVAQTRGGQRFEEFRRVAQAGAPFYEGRWAQAVEALRGVAADLT